MANSPLHVFEHPWFWCGFLGWIVAQLIKLVTDLVTNHKVDFSYLVSTGGMPSAHSSMACGLATGIGLTEGFDTPLFVLALAFAAVIMFDAAGVRNAAGQQARLLNQIADELFTDGHFNAPKMKELLGHTRLEVFAGMGTGIVVAVLVVWLGWPNLLA